MGWDNRIDVEVCEHGYPKSLCLECPTEEELI